MDAKRRWLNHPVSRIIQHLTFWALSYYIFLHLFKPGFKPEKVDFIYTALFQASILPAVYINLEFLLPRLGKTNRWWWYLPSVLFLAVFFSWINYSFFQNWSNSVLPDYFFISYYTGWQVLLFFTVYLSLTSLLKLSKSWFTVNELRKELLFTEKEKVQMELKALKSQVNPHFFFNTLNGIYSMALDKDERLPDTVLQLSGLMRYFLYESKEDFVPLAKEIEVLKDYIALQKIRSDENLKMETVIENGPDHQQIAPLLLITFMENSFKHGAKSSARSSFIRLYLHVIGNTLNFHLENNKGVVDDTVKNEYKGVGLENVKRRLELIYPGKHDLIIRETEDRFFVKLQLQL
jgi:sensor histidine kinase YesM